MTKAKTQAEKAHLWRLKNKLTVFELGILTGYSIEAIYSFERGTTPQRNWIAREKASTKPALIQDWVWLRYKNACSGVERKLRSGKEWDWA